MHCLHAYKWGGPWPEATRIKSNIINAVIYVQEMRRLFMLNLFISMQADLLLKAASSVMDLLNVPSFLNPRLVQRVYDNPIQAANHGRST